MVHQSDKKKNIAVDLLPEARQVIENLRDDTGVPNTEAMKRILEWFASLDRKLRLAVLTRDVETRDELLQLAVEKMVYGDGAAKMIGPLDQLNYDEAVKLARRVNDHVHSMGKQYETEAKRLIREKQEKRRHSS